jgi:P27 family predicted phage terminase small subunit
MRGRKPKPTARRKFEGNPGKRPFNLQEPQHDVPTEAFDRPPAELAAQPLAAAEWRRLAPVLRRSRTVTEADRSALLALCLEWARYLEATAQIRKDGLVIRTKKTRYPMPNPYLPIATRALANCSRLWPELGLTPASRTRVHAAPAPPDDDPFAEFDPPEKPTSTRLH